MQTTNLIQGSPEWLAHRRSHFNASDAPAMMGCSPYRTRTQLLHEMHTGIAPEVDPVTQRRFDDGHRFEALARPLAEEIIGEDLFPVTGTKGKLSASFDGLTMGEDTAFEHKSLNAELRKAFDAIESIAPEYRDKHGGAELPMAYRVQNEQQCMVSGAGRVLFMASKWVGEKLEEERHCWYYSDPALAAEIRAGWDQFEIDLATYVPTEAAAAIAPTAKLRSALPVLLFEAKGEVTACNVDEFKVEVLERINAVNMKLLTDQDFADGDADAKWLRDVSIGMKAAVQRVRSGMVSVNEVLTVLEQLDDLATDKAIAVEKLVKARKEQIKVEFVQHGAQALAAHLEALNKRLGKPYMPAVRADFATAIKGKRTVDSLRDAVDTTLANAKIEANALADKIQVNLNLLRETAMNHAFLFADTPQIVLKAADDFATLVKSRIDEHDKAEAARLEAQREKIRQEELARIEREQAEAARQAAAKVDAEKAAAAELERQAEAAKIAAAAAAIKAADPAPAQTTIAQAATETVAVAAPVASAPAAPAPNVVRMRAAAPAPIASTPPTLKLGAIAERLGFALTADFLKVLGFEPAATDRASKLYHEASFSLICAALVAHIEAVQAQQAA